MRPKFLPKKPTDYDGNLPEQQRRIQEMQEQMDTHCQYLARVGSVCNKCGRIHVSPFKRPIL